MRSGINLDLLNYYKLGDIGKGAFGVVYKIQSIRLKCIYAAKESLNVIADNSEMLEDLLREINIMAKINHPSIIKYIGFSKKNFQNEQKPVIVSEYLPHGTLENLLQLSFDDEAPPEFDYTKKLIILYGISSAMSFLHSNDILHRDLKPANILLDESLNPKICDFGISKFEQTGDESSQLKGTPLFLAPEIIKDLQYSKAGDVYAFALIAYELIVNEQPFKGDNLFMLFQKVKNGFRPEFDGLIEDCYQSLIERCWSQEPSERPIFDEIKEELKNNDEFINDEINEEVYYEYIKYIDEYLASFESDTFEATTLDYKNNFDQEKLNNQAYQLEAGIGCVKNPSEARLLFKKSADSTNIEGMMNYARMCLNGIGGEQNIPDYLKYLKKACYYNNKEAKYEYGLLLEEGQFVERNLIDALRFFKAAAELRYDKACFKYSKLKRSSDTLMFCKKATFSDDPELKDKASKLYKKILNNVINDDNDKEDDMVNVTKREFNMVTQTVTLNEIQYNYTNEKIISDPNELQNQLKMLNSNEMQNRSELVNNENMGSNSNELQKHSELLNNENFISDPNELQNHSELLNNESFNYDQNELKTHSEFLTDENINSNSKELKLLNNNDLNSDPNESQNRSELINIEKLNSDQNEPQNHCEFLTDENLPQGIDNVRNIINQQIKQNEPLIILSDDCNHRFYFPFNNVDDLLCDEGKRIVNYIEFNVELDKLKVRSQNKKIFFPQGIENCESLLIQERDSNGCVFALSRRTSTNHSYYYFKSAFMHRFPGKCSENIYFKKNREEVQHELDLLKERKGKQEYVGGYEYSEQLLLNALENDESVLVVTAWFFDKKKFCGSDL